MALAFGSWLGLGVDNGPVVPRSSMLDPRPTGIIRGRVDDVPPGTYAVAVWNETVRGDPPRRTVTVGEVDVDFTIR